MVKGKLHSIETMGLVDGPGIRTVFFLQGCPLKCSYCHNPDSQPLETCKTISPEEVLAMALRYKSYYKRSGGGVTFSGGEALLQGEFLVQSLKLLKENGIHTALDTSGVGDSRYYDEILKYLDLIMLDLKHPDPRAYRDLTGRSMDSYNNFTKYLDHYKGKLILRHVMVPGMTDNMDSIQNLVLSLSSFVHQVDKIEILPYHKMGIDKYKELGIEYKLKGVPEMDKSLAKEYEKYANHSLDRMKANYSRKIG